MNYYNENDPFCVEWLRKLIDFDMIADGIVDFRDIKHVKPGDLNDFDQCHFFAGIGTWSYALRLAGWPDDKPVWTGSCPCQPFSAAGQRKGFKDDRHLWPEWFRLIRERRPVTIFGEQVGSALSWLDLVSRDLENEDYAIGSAIMGAHSVGAPHIRQRIYWVAESRCEKRTSLSSARSSKHGGVVESGSSGRQWRQEATSRYDNDREASERSQSEYGTSVTSSHWSDCDWLSCIDGKSRPVEPGTFPLAHGIANRVGLLRGYGNAIVPQQAEAFIKAYMSLGT